MRWLLWMVLGAILLMPSALSAQVGPSSVAAEARTMKTLAELIHTEDPAWPLVESWRDSARSRVEILAPVDDKTREAALVAAQVTTRSTLGAVVYQTGGILVDHGFLRILGSGSPRMPRSLAGWNVGRTGDSGIRPTFLLVADDVAGGFFAIDGGGLGFQQGSVAYFSPESLRWIDLGMGYSDFIRWSFSGNLDAFYESLRWPGWEAEVAKIGGDQTLSIYPPLSTRGGGIGGRNRRPVSVSEIYDLHVGRVKAE